jgi:hypothetical protein
MMGKGIGQKMRLKQGNIGTRVSCNVTAIVWKDKLYGSILTNMLLLPAEGNFCDEHGKSLKLAIVQDRNRHMGKQTNLTA